METKREMVLRYAGNGFWTLYAPGTLISFFSRREALRYAKKHGIKITEKERSFLYE